MIRFANVDCSLTEWSQSRILPTSIHRPPLKHAPFHFHLISQKQKVRSVTIPQERKHELFPKITIRYSRPFNAPGEVDGAPVRASGEAVVGIGFGREIRALGRWYESYEGNQDQVTNFLDGGVKKKL